MAVFAAVAATTGFDPAHLTQFAASLAPWGPVTTLRTGDSAFGAAFATPPHGWQAQSAVAPNGSTVVALARIDARSDLTAALNAPAGHSDAALLLDAYAKWDSAMVDHVIGDYAFAIWDAPRRRLFAATDRLGLCPLFHAQAGGALLISTSIAALRDTGGFGDALDQTFLADFLAFGFSLDTTATVHPGIRRIPAGHTMMWRGGTPEIRRYWSPPAYRAPSLRPPAALGEEFRHLLFQAVRDRLPASGPISLQLSGGMDSPSVAAAIHAAIGADGIAERVTGHTVVYRDYPEEEGYYAGLVARHLGIPTREWIAEDYLSRPGDLASPAIGDQPDAIREISCEYHITREAGRTGAMHFTGLGADVLFNGRAAGIGVLVAEHSLGAILRYRGLYGSWPPTGLRGRVGKLVRRRRMQPISALIRPEIAARTRLAERQAEMHTVTTMGLSGLAAPQWTNLMGMGSPANTRLTMAVSHPFVDVRLIDFVATLPAPAMHRKAVLREAMQRHLPPEIIARPKTPLGMVSPVSRATGPAQARLRRLMASGVCDALVNPAAIDAPLDREAGFLNRLEALAFWLQATGRTA